MKDFIKRYWTGIFILAIICGCTGYYIYSYQQKKIDKLQKDLEKEKEERRKQHVEDSIKATPEYIDSVRKSEKLFSDWENKRKNLEEKEIVGFVYENDSIYHSCFHHVHIIYHPAIPLSTNFLDIDIECLRFVTKQEAVGLGLRECIKCLEIFSTYDDYQNGELIRRDEVDDLY